MIVNKEKKYSLYLFTVSLFGISVCYIVINYKNNYIILKFLSKKILI